MSFASTMALIGEGITVILFLCACINSVVVKPLQKSIDALSGQIARLREEITKSDERLDCLENRVIILEERAKS